MADDDMVEPDPERAVGGGSTSDTARQTPLGRAEDIFLHLDHGVGTRRAPAQSPDCRVLGDDRADRAS